MTVRETLQFALENSVAQPPEAKKDTECHKLHHQKVELVLKLLGLEEAADTIAGNDLTRGISGGQKKRLTIGEFVITNARLLALDEVTNGLDAYVATDLTRSLRQWTRISGGSVVAALQQPTPEIFWQFDDVLLMREGRIVYHGPTGQVIDYIHWMGADKPDNMDEVSNGNGNTNSNSYASLLHII
jgi:ABC-type multidrug transport system ATPase subunit